MQCQIFEDLKVNQSLLIRISQLPKSKSHVVNYTLKNIISLKKHNKEYTQDTVYVHQ